MWCGGTENATECGCCFLINTPTLKSTFTRQKSPQLIDSLEFINKILIYCSTYRAPNIALSLDIL